MNRVFFFSVFVFVGFESSCDNDRGGKVRVLIMLEPFIAVLVGTTVPKLCECLCVHLKGLNS